MMRKHKYLAVILLLTSLVISIINTPASAASFQKDGDKPSDLQLLLNGRIWHNKYAKASGNQFFLTNGFLKGSVTVNGKKYDNLDLQYDIAGDELILRKDPNPVIMMNREMVDSFTLKYGDRTYRIINERIDTNVIHSGYINILYSGSTALYVKYSKKILPLGDDGLYDLFYQESRIYIRSGGNLNQVDGKRELLLLLSDRKKELKMFIKNNRQGNYRLSKKDPETFIPVLAYYDSLKK